MLLYSALNFGKLFHTRPHPTLRQLREGRGVGGEGFPVLAPPLLLRLPAGAALGEDALQQDAGGLILAALGAGQLCLGGDQAALAGVIQDAGPVALQVGPGAAQRRHRCIQPRELSLDFGHNPPLLGDRSYGEGVRPQIIAAYGVKRSTC